MPRFLRCFVFAAIALWCSASLAAEPMDKCVDRIAATNAASAAFDRLPNVRYSCIALRSGRHLLLAQAGDPAKPAIVLVHGLGDNAHRDWRATIPALTSQFNVVAFDLPGFGSSEPPAQPFSLPLLADTLGEVVELLQLRRFHLVGHSLGGAVSLYYAQQHQERIDHLVLVDVAGVFIKPVFLRFLLNANAADAGLGSVDSALGALNSVLPGGGDGLLDAIEDSTDLGRMLMSSPGVRSALFGDGAIGDAALDLLNYDFTKAIRETRVPTAVIWGSTDSVTPLRTGTLLAARMPDAKLYLIDGAGHMAMNQRPAPFNQTLLSALKQSPPMASPPPVDKTPRGNVSCLNQPGMRYSGTYDTISLQNCANATIVNAKARNIKAVGSSLTIENTVIDGGDIALDVASTSVTATAVTLNGRTTIRANGGRLDFAGVSVRASAKAVDVVGSSRIYFSVSDIDAPDYHGDAHFAWPPLGKR